MVGKPSFMLSQVVRRLSEQRIVKTDESKQKLKKEHDSGPIPDAYCDCKQYLYIKSNKQQFCINEKDSCMRLDDRIGKIVNILIREDEVYVVYKLFKRSRQIFSTPLDSQLLGIHIVSELQNSTFADKLSNIQAKCVLLPYTGDTYVAIRMTDNVW